MLYNTYRPADFSEVKGQEDVLLTLKRQSQTGNFGHAYLLAGHRGSGKTTIARILSKAVNCQNLSENGPCKICESCLAAKESLDILEPDAASNNGVDKIKEMMAQTRYQPVQLHKKVFIIDEVHNLSTAAFDVLLKPLEEPPAYCTFILCTTELHKIPVEALITSDLATKPMPQDIPDFDVFYSKNNLDIPAFGNETLKPLDIPSEEKEKDVEVQKEVMPTHRTDKDAPLTDNSMK